MAFFRNIFRRFIGFLKSFSGKEFLVFILLLAFLAVFAKIAFFGIEVDIIEQKEKGSMRGALKEAREKMK